MAEIYRDAYLAAATANLTGDPMNAIGLDDAFFEINVTASAATLQATIVFETSITQNAYLAASNGAPVASSDGSLTYNASTGVFTINNPGSGQTRVALLRFDRPAKWLRPRYVYGSGGGTVLVRVVGWGFQVDTTP